MNRLILAILPFLTIVACSSGTEPTTPPTTTTDGTCATVNPDDVVDSCVDTLHSEYACVMANLPTVYTAIGCKGTPKLMHPEDGTLIVRADGREGCSEIVNYKGEALTCCPVCAPGRVVCNDGSGKCCDK